MQGGDSAAAAGVADHPLEVSPAVGAEEAGGPVEESNGHSHRRATGELVVEHTDFRKAKSKWQEKLDEALAKKEQEQIIAELHQMKTSEKESERATYQLLRDEGYTVEGNAFRERQEKHDEVLARQIAEREARELKKGHATADGEVAHSSVGGAGQHSHHSQHASGEAPAHRHASSDYHEHHHSPRAPAVHGEAHHRRAAQGDEAMRRSIHEREAAQRAHNVERHSSSSPHFLPGELFHRDAGHHHSHDERHHHSHISAAASDDTCTGDEKGKSSKKSVVQRIFSTMHGH